MRFSPTFYRTAAICSFASVVTTLMLIFLPRFYGPATSFEHRLELVQHPLWQLRAWAYLIHPFLVLGAALGVAAALRRVATGAAASGLVGFMLWAFTEAAQQTLTLVAFRRWAAEYRAADATVRETLRAQIGVYDAVWDAMYLLLLIAFLAGNVLYALATVRGRGLTCVLSFFYVGAALLTLAIISGELGGPTVPPVLGAWLYPALQPAARATIGLWLWRASSAEEGSAAPA